MEKKGLIIPVLFLFFINFVSAQFYGGFTDFLYNIDPNAMTLGVLFIVLFAILFFSLSRIFKDKYGYPNKTIATIVALALSVLCVYWVNRTGFDIPGLFYSIGISEEILYIIAPLVVLAGLIFIFTRFKTKRFGKTLLILGGLLLVLSFTDLVYEKGFLVIVSIAMIVVGLVLVLRRPRGARGPKPWREPRPRREPKPRREPRPRRPPREREGPIGPVGPRGPTGEAGRSEGRRFGTTPRRPRPEGRRFGTTPREPRPEAGREQRRQEREQRAQYKAQQEEARRQEREQRKLISDQRREQRSGAEREERLLITDQRKEQRSAEREERAQQVETGRQQRKQERQRRERLAFLINDFNKLQRKDPGDPRLRDLVEEIKRLRREKR